MQYKKILSLNDGGFYVDNIGMYNGFPIPPCDTYVPKGERYTNRFFYIVSGTTVFELKNKKLITATTGDIVYLPYGVSYHSWWEETPKSECITLLFEMRDHSGEEISLGEQIEVIYNDSTKKFQEVLYKMHSIYHARTVNWRLL